MRKKLQSKISVAYYFYVQKRKLITTHKLVTYTKSYVICTESRRHNEHIEQFQEYEVSFSIFATFTINKYANKRKRIISQFSFHRLIINNKK